MDRDDEIRGNVIDMNKGEANRTRIVNNYAGRFSNESSRKLNIPNSRLPEGSSRSPLSRDIEVRFMERRDIEGVTNVLDSVYPELMEPGFEEDRWMPCHFEKSLEKFPQGHIVVLKDGKVIGFSLSFIIDEERLKTDNTEEDTEGEGFLDTHDPENGNVLYISEVTIKPEYQRQGLGKKLVRAQQRLSKELGLDGCVGTSLLPGYDEYPEEYSVYEYIALRQQDGRLENRNLRFYEDCGLVWGDDDVMKDYVADPRSRGWAVRMKWTPSDDSK